MSAEARYRMPVTALNERGVQGIIKQLVEERDKIQKLESELRMRRRFRSGLVAKLLFRGFSTRHIGELSGLSSVSVSNINKANVVEFERLRLLASNGADE